MQNSAAFGAARELDFEKDPVGSLGQLICDRRDLSSSDNTSASVRSTGPMGIVGTTGNSSGGSLKRQRFPELAAPGAVLA